MALPRNAENYEAMGQTMYRCVDHCCRTCLGRVLQSEGGIFVCSTCEATAAHSVEDICWCGIVRVPDGRRLGFQCARNFDPSGECPAVIIIRFGQRIPGQPFQAEGIARPIKWDAAPWS